MAQRLKTAHPRMKSHKVSFICTGITIYVFFNLKCLSFHLLPESPRASGSSHPDLLIALPPAVNDSSEAEQNNSSDEDPEVPLSRGNSNFYNYRPSILERPFTRFFVRIDSDSFRFLSLRIRFRIRFQITKRISVVFWHKNPQMSSISTYFYIVY